MTATAPRTRLGSNLASLRATARPNKLIAELADAAAKAAHIAAADRAARLAVALLAEGNTETAALLFKSAIEHRAAA
ncbi:hypothetical protein [Streptosporangium sp. CA-115845]|uniref:hypothetical protein n=1 Tax=Streptosporangium sp. CA-115845 TaxID=3240071 RepID=UPI003D8B6DB3